MNVRLAIATVCALLGCANPPASAQDHVTVYGTLAAALRASTHTDSRASARTELTGTNLGAGIWGLRGQEDLGGALTVRFKLESGYFVDNGVQRNNNALFGREASAGIGGRFGQLDIGRLQVTGSAAEPLVRVDPLGGGGLSETIWPGLWSGASYSNALRYRLTRGAWTAGAMVSLGEQAGNARAGRMQALTGLYLEGPLLVSGAAQTTYDGAGLRARVAVVGATYTFGRATVHGALLRTSRERGFVIGAAAGAPLFNQDMGLAGIPAPAAQRTAFHLLGLSLNLGGPWRLRSAYFDARSPRATLLSATEGGSQRAVYSVLSCELSRRTSVLASIDLNRWQGGWGGYWGASAASLAAYHPDGSDTRRTVGLGIRHVF